MTTTTTPIRGDHGYGGSIYKRNKTDINDIVNLVPLYRNIPSDFALEDFEQLASERIDVLLNLESAKARGADHIELRKRLKELISKKHLGDLKSAEHLQQDLLSHWVLRLAFSASEDTRRRFADFEKDLFEFRMSELNALQRKTFLQVHEFRYELLEGSELSKLQEDLDVCRRGLFQSKDLGSDPPKQDYYRVPFTEVCRLVKSRQVLIRNGFAFVPDDKLIEAISSRVLEDLSANLLISSRALPFIMRDERVEGLLVKLQKVELGTAHVATLSGTVTKDQLPMLAKRSFPMCARNLEGTLSRLHHLKHFSRLQFTLFLKGIGLSMEDCLTYLRQEFMRKPMTMEEFNKEYSYSVRHAYGKEGARKNYGAWSCLKAINHEGQGVAEKTVAHGCPFAHVKDKVKMERLLKDMGCVTSDAVVAKIIEEFAQNKPQIACRLHWEALHPGGDSESVGNHPNAWFDESVKYYKKKDLGQQQGDAAVASASAVAGFVG